MCAEPEEHGSRDVVVRVHRSSRDVWGDPMRLERQLPKGYSNRGADMGRCSDDISRGTDTSRIRLQRMHLDSGGYDAQGAYWGRPSDLYVASWEFEDFVRFAFYRGSSRDDVKQKILKEAPYARFYR